MKSLIEVLNEGHIGDLKNVRYIRHYTTLEGLASIIELGYIKTNKSKGDIDWIGYNIGKSEVVSFHDARTDPEIEFIENANDNEYRMQNTQTLGLHQHRICAFIEYNFDLLPENIQKQADFIKILERYVPEFCNLWNRIWAIKNEIPKKDLKSINNYNDLVNYLASHKFEEDYEDIDGAYWCLDKFEKEEIVDMIKRRNLSSYSDSEQKVLLQAAIDDNEKEVFKILKQHGWENGDEYNHFIYQYSAWEDHSFIEYIQKRYLKTNNNKVNIEIRMGCNMPINIKGCTIHFFKGIADSFELKGIFDNFDYEHLITQLYEMPNVEIYEPGDDYSLIM